MSTEPTLKEKTAKGLFWGGVSNGTIQVLSGVFGIVLARILNEDDYGLIEMLTIFSAISSSIINSGFSTTLTNKKDANHADYNAVFWFTVLISIFLYVILFFSAPLIADFYDKPKLIPLARVLFLAFVFSGIASVSHTVMHKKLMVKQQGIIEITSMTIAGIVGIFLALKGYGYWALALQSLFFVSLGSILRFIIAPWKPTLQINFHPIVKMFPFSIKIFLTQIFSQINANIFSVLIGKYNDEGEVGIYSQGHKWMNMANGLLTGMINSVAHPVLVHVQGEKERQQNIFRKMVRFGAFLSFPLMLGLAFVAEEFIVIAIGDRWLPSVPYLQIFCLWGMISFLWNLYTYLLLTHDKSDIYMYGMIGIGIFQLAVIFALHSFGIFYMITGYIVVYYLGLLVWQHYASKLIGLRLWDIIKDIAPYLLISVGCFFVTWLMVRGIDNIYLRIVTKIFISVILYILVMKLSRSTIFEESVKFILKKNQDNNSL